MTLTGIVMTFSVFPSPENQIPVFHHRPPPPTTVSWLCCLVINVLFYYAAHLPPCYPFAGS